jgi:putative endonuclease
VAYYVYILLCNDGSFYTGFTKDVEERAKLHINGKGARYTKAHPPKKVVHVEEFATRSEAMRRERTIKKLSHEQKNKIIDSHKQPKSAAINKRKSQESSPA